MGIGLVLVLEKIEEYNSLRNDCNLRCNHLAADAKGSFPVIASIYSSPMVLDA
jgi:hypothetical protein